MIPKQLQTAGQTQLPTFCFCSVCSRSEGSAFHAKFLGVTATTVMRRVLNEDSGHHNTQQIKILIADDHAIFAEALRLLLERQYMVIGTVAGSRALVEEGIRLRPDVIVTDLSMPLLNGLDAARRIKEAIPKVKFAFLTMHDDPQLAAAALALGSVAFVLKRSGALELLEAIEEILRGRCFFRPD